MHFEEDSRTAILDESLTHEEFEYIQQLKIDFSKILLRDCLSKMKKIPEFKRVKGFDLITFSILYATYEEQMFF